MRRELSTLRESSGSRVMALLTGASTSSSRSSMRFYASDSSDQGPLPKLKKRKLASNGKALLKRKRVIPSSDSASESAASIVGPSSSQVKPKPKPKRTTSSRKTAKAKKELDVVIRSQAGQISD